MNVQDPIGDFMNCLGVIALVDRSSSEREMRRCKDRLKRSHELHIPALLFCLFEAKVSQNDDKKLIAENDRRDPFFLSTKVRHILWFGV